MRASSIALKSNPGEMTHRLRGVIERLTIPSEVLRDERKRPATGFNELIANLTGAIDETVLPRRFALFAEDTPVASMVVSNRRLLELEVEGNRIRVDDGKDAAPDIVARNYASALRALSTRSGPLVLRIIGRVPATVTNNAACSARHLSCFSDSTCFKNRLKIFLRELHPKSHGWVYRAGDDDATAHDPDKKVFKSLCQLEEKIRSDAATRSGIRHVDRPSPTLATFAIAAELQAMVVTDGTEQVIIALPQAEMPLAMQHWNTIYGYR